MAEAASEAPQGSVLGTIIFVIYVNDSADYLTIDHLLYADDVRLRSSPNAQPIQTVSTALDLRLLPNTVLSGMFFLPKAILRESYL